jgi:hypothetical protein
MGWGMDAVEYCEVGGPFYRAGEAGRWPAGSDGSGGAFSIGGRLRRGGEAKRRQCRLREGKGGGDREASGPVRRVWPEGMGGTSALGRETAVGTAARGRRRRRQLLVLYVF